MRFAAALLLLTGCSSKTDSIRLTGVVRLPPGVTEIHNEVAAPEGARDVEVVGDGSVLHAAADFRGRAIFTVNSGVRIRFRDFTIDGNRAALEQRAALPGSNTPFSRFTANNGILIEGGSDVSIIHVNFREVAGFPILVSGARDVRVEGVKIENSGSRNAAGKNNTTGGILIEEGSVHFQVLDCELRNVRGNGVWTHSLYTSPRNADGTIAGNHFTSIGRDAIQVGHATQVRVERNKGERIGYPEPDVDAIPVAIDTAGNVDRSVYSGNRFTEINGKCIDLDGFHDGAVTGNVCLNLGNFGIVMNNTNPDMQSEAVTIADNTIEGSQYGGIFVIGGPNKILRNTLRDLNRSRSTEDLLRSGIYLGARAERPAVAKGNIVEGNSISGFQVKCIAAAPGVSMGANKVAGNQCLDDPPKRATP